MEQQNSNEVRGAAIVGAVGMWRGQNGRGPME
jgi:hypothetical protein